MYVLDYHRYRQRMCTQKYTICRENTHRVQSLVGGGAGGVQSDHQSPFKSMTILEGTSKVPTTCGRGTMAVWWVVPKPTLVVTIYQSTTIVQYTGIHCKCTMDRQRGGHTASFPDPIQQTEGLSLQTEGLSLQTEGLGCWNRKSLQTEGLGCWNRKVYKQLRPFLNGIWNTV